MADDLDRLRMEYEQREHRLEHSERYALSNAPHLFSIQSRQRALFSLLKKCNIPSLSGLSILEIGCGDGAVLNEYIYLGASPNLLQGTDLLLRRSFHAAIYSPLSLITCADGQHLPYPPISFNLVLQYTVFSSILDPSVRHHIAAEMLRVLKPGGIIIWYDYWLNPTNPQTRGVRPAEVRKLFPGCTFIFTRITLAPPITRLLAGRSWWFCHLLEALKVFNTHYLVAIRPSSSSGDFPQSS